MNMTLKGDAARLCHNPPPSSNFLKSAFDFPACASAHCAEASLGNATVRRAPHRTGLLHITPGARVDGRRFGIAFGGSGSGGRSLKMSRHIGQARVA
jgi:hypothetical protein